MKMTLAPYLMTVRTTRAAVVPYIRRENGLKFLLGVDQKSKDITDIGGGVKLNEYALNGADRELSEETIGIFKKYLCDQILMYKSVALYHEKMKLSSIFVPVTDEMYNTVVSEFKKRKKEKTHNIKRTCNEMEQLLWVDEQEFKKLVSGETKGMWKRVRSFYLKAVDDNFMKLLSNLY